MTSRWPLLACAALSTLDLVAAALPVSQPVLIPLGLATAYLALGYAARRALGIPDAERSEELTLSTAASLGLLVVTGLVLNLAPAGLTRTSWTLATGGLLLVASAVGLARGVDSSAAAGRGVRARLRPAYLLRAVAVLALVGASVGVAVSSQRTLNDRSHFTELGLAGAAHDVVTVRSHEPAPTAYRLVVAPNGQSATSYDLRLRPGGTWQHALPLPTSRPVSVDLYRAGETEPYRHVALR